MIRNMQQAFLQAMEAMGGPMGHAGQFRLELRCYSAAFMDTMGEERINQLNFGGKIILPPSALDILTRLHIQYPMQFKITNVDPDQQRSTHVGVIEFTADEGRCYAPFWILRQLGLQEGDMVVVEYASLRPAKHLVLQPLEADFMDITDQRAVLEVKMREFSCLTRGDVFSIHYNNRVYDIRVVAAEPVNAVSVVECDVTFDIKTPEGYTSPSVSNQAAEQDEMDTGDHLAPHGGPTTVTKHVAFYGEGKRLDGKKMNKDQKKMSPLQAENGPASQQNAIIPDYDYKPGVLRFYTNYLRPEVREQQELAQKVSSEQGSSQGSGPTAFSGEGHKLRDRKRQK